MVERMFRAMARRAGDGDLQAITELARLQGVLDNNLWQAVDAAREQYGYSWAEIARPLGITRQAAQQRFGPVAS